MNSHTHKTKCSICSKPLTAHCPSDPDLTVTCFKCAFDALKPVRDRVSKGERLNG